MKSFRVLLCCLLLLPVLCLAQQCPLGWSTGGPLSNSVIGVGGYYVQDVGAQEFGMKVIITPLPDPLNNNVASPNVIPDFPAEGWSGYAWSQGCVTSTMTPDGDGSGQVEWPQGVPSGYYAFTLEVNTPYSNGWQPVGTFYAWCRDYQWTIQPPQQTPGWVTGFTGGTWDSTGGQVTGQILGVTVQISGQQAPNGVTVALTNKANGQATSAETAAGMVIWNPVNPGSYTLQVSGTVNGVTYSGGVAVTMGTTDQYIVMNCDASGVVQSSTVNGVNQSPSSSDAINTSGFWQSLCQSLFVPSQNGINAAMAPINQLSQWGPFGYIAVLRDQLNTATGTPDPYWENGPSINFPTMDPTTGYLIADSTRSRTDADLSVQWQQSPVWQNCRQALGAVTYLFFAASLMKWLRVKLRV